MPTSRTLTVVGARYVFSKLGRHSTNGYSCLPQIKCAAGLPAMTTHSVPSESLGMWRRTLLEQAGVIDTSTLVLVIQAEQYHADLPIPGNCLDFENAKSLADCSSEQLRWLATQQGLTGITEINANILNGCEITIISHPTASGILNEIQDQGLGKILHSPLPFREREIMSLM